MGILDKFDPYAMISPKTDADYYALVDEAIRIMDDINQILDDCYSACKKDKDDK